MYSEPEYRIGIRWEPNNTVVPTITYGSAINGSQAAGFEVGIMIFSLQFLNL